MIKSAVGVGPGSKETALTLPMILSSPCYSTDFWLVIREMASCGADVTCVCVYVCVCMSVCVCGCGFVCVSEGVRGRGRKTQR